MPSQITGKLRINKSVQSELAKKMVTLNDDKEDINEYIDLANHLSDIRNLIVHDKKLNLIDYGDGDVKVEHFRSQGKFLYKQLRYEELHDFYANCDKISNFILPRISPSIMNAQDINFTALLKGVTSGLTTDAVIARYF